MTLAVLVVALWSERPEGVAALVWAAAAATVPPSIYVLLQAHGMDPFDWGFDAAEAARLVKRHAQYPPGTMGNSNFAGGYLGIAAPAVVYAFVAARGPVARLAIASVGALLGVGLWSTHSRGGLLAAAAGLGIMLMLVARSRRVRALLVVGALAAVAVLGFAVVRNASPSGGSGGAEATVLRSDTLVSRTDYWRAAIDMWLEHPVLGTGPETFLSQYPPIRPPSDGANFGLVLPDKPHNIYLEWAVSAGVLGAGTYLALIAIVLFQGVRRAARLEGRPRALVVALVAMLVAYLVQGFFSIDQPPLNSDGLAGAGRDRRAGGPVPRAGAAEVGGGGGGPRGRRPRDPPGASGGAVSISLAGARDCSDRRRCPRRGRGPGARGRRPRASGRDPGPSLPGAS